MPEIQRTLVLSLSHLPYDLVKAMETVDADQERDETMATHEEQALVARVTFDIVTYGYMVWVGESADEVDDFDGWPEELIEPVNLAHANGCTWIRFDQDGPIEPMLPKWEW